jgi:hypothetical protein
MRADAIVGLLALGLGVATASGVAAEKAAPRPAVANAVVAIAPMVQVRPLGMTTPPTTAFCKAKYHFSCYQPFQLERAYDLVPLYQEGYDGRGRTIVIVDAYGSPTIHHDLEAGDNTVSFKQDGHWYKVVGFDAGPGYDLASGLGTVDAAEFVPELVAASSHRTGGQTSPSGASEQRQATWRTVPVDNGGVGGR